MLDQRGRGVPLREEEDGGGVIGRHKASDYVVLPKYKRRRTVSSLSSLLSTPQLLMQQFLANSQQEVCGFHKNNRNFTHIVEYKSILDAVRDKDIFGHIKIDTIVRFCWYFIKHYTTAEEFELLSYLFNYYSTCQKRIIQSTLLNRRNLFVPRLSHFCVNLSSQTVGCSLRHTLTR